MNRYVAAGLIEDAWAGKNIIYIANDQREARYAFLEVRDTLDDRDTRIARIISSNGRDSIDLTSGGSIRFTSQTQSLRGYAADIVFMDEIHDPRILEQIRPVVLARPNGELIRS